MILWTFGGLSRPPGDDGNEGSRGRNRDASLAHVAGKWTSAQRAMRGKLCPTPQEVLGEHARTHR